MYLFAIFDKINFFKKLVYIFFYMIMDFCNPFAPIANDPSIFEPLNDLLGCLASSFCPLDIKFYCCLKLELMSCLDDKLLYKIFYL